MKRLRRRSRWQNRGQKHDAAAGSLSCLPVSLLCRGLPSSPPVEVSSVASASSRHQRSAAVDDVNHVDHRPAGTTEQPRTNGTAVLGGNGLGLQSYDHFIATLLKERSLVKDGVAADSEKPLVNNRPRTLPAARLRQRRPLIDRTEHETRANGNGYDRRSLPGVVSKPAADRSFKLEGEQFVLAASKDVGVNIVTEYVDERQPQTELDTGRSATETTADDAPSTLTKLATLDCSPRQRQRRRKQKTGRQGATTVTKGCDNATSQVPVQDDYNVTKDDATLIDNDAKTDLVTHCDRSAVDWRQDSEDSGHGLATSYTFYQVDPVRDQDNELSRSTTVTVSDDSKPATRCDSTNVHRQCEDTADLFGLSFDASITPFIDCDNLEVESFQQENEPPVSVEQEVQTRSTSIVVDRWKNAEGELVYSSPGMRASSLQFCCRITGANSDLHVNPVCRRSTLTQSDERTVRGRRRRQCCSYPSLTSSATDQISELDASLASLDQLTTDVETGGESQLLETCRCSIAWPQTASDLVNSEEVRNELNERQPPDTTRRPIGRSNTTADISTAPLQTPNDLNHPSAGCQHLAGAFASLPSNDVSQLNPEKFGHRPLTDKINVSRRDVRVFCVFGRRRGRENARCDGKASKCLLRIEFILTSSQIEDQRTTFLFAQRKTTMERDHVVDGEADDVQNLPFCCSSTCSSSDVNLAVISDDIDDVINGAQQHVYMARNSVAMEGVESLMISQPRSIEGAFDTSPPNSAHSAIDAAHLAVDIQSAGGSTPCGISSGNLNDVSQSLTVYEFAEVTSIFRNFAADLLPATGRELSVVPYGAARRREDKSPSKALVPRTAPSVTYSGAVVPYGTRSQVSCPLPLMTWTWNRNDFSASRQQTTQDDVTHIPYVSLCTTLNVEPSIDNFTLVGLLTRNTCSRHR